MKQGSVRVENHHVVAGGGKLQAGGVRGDCCELAAAIHSQGHWRKHFCRREILANVAGRTVFLAGCGDAYLVRRASGTCITLVKKRCVWYLRAKFKPRSELPYAEGEEFMEVMLLDRGAGVRPVQGGISNSRNPAAISNNVEESAPVEKACGAISLNRGRQGRAHSQRACCVQDLVVVSVASDVARMHQPSCRSKRNRDPGDCHYLKRTRRSAAGDE